MAESPTQSHSEPSTETSPTSSRSNYTSPTLFSRYDSGLETRSPTEPPSATTDSIPKPPDATPVTVYEVGSLPQHHYRIIPPRIAGHGYLVVPRKSIPSWAGVVILLGAFAWAVWCAVFLDRFIEGKRGDWGQGNWGGY